MSYINEYIITVKNPKSDNDSKINGTINFIEDGDKLGSYSILKGLPNPWTNPITNQIVSNNTGEIFYNILPLQGTTTSLAESTINSLQNILLETYGISVILQYISTDYVNTTSLISNTGTTSSIITSTSSATASNGDKLQEFIFNVELQDVFFNQNTGNLFIIGKEDNILLDSNESDIASLYNEDLFAGAEEVALKLEFDSFPQSIDNIDSTDSVGYDTPSPEVRPVKIHIDGNSWYAVAANYISKKEGFLSHAKWDINHYRGGYGTQFKLVGSNLIEVTSTTTFTEQEAINTLYYQLKADYEPVMINSFGSANWARLNKNQKAAIVSLAYNCGPYIYTTAGASTRSYARMIKEGVATHNANLISKGISRGPIRGGGRVYSSLVTRRAEEAGLALA